MRIYTALLMDVDGTLLDFKAAERYAFTHAMAIHGFAADENAYRSYSAINLSLWEAHERGEITRDRLIVERFERLFERLSLTVDAEAFEEDYQRLLGENHTLFPETVPVLSYLYGRVPLYVVTNGVEETQMSRLRDSGIDKYMEDIFISGRLGVQKPKREFFQACFERMGAEAAARPLVVGDSLTSDILGGVAADIDTCWFNPDRKPRTYFPARDGTAGESVWEERRRGGYQDYVIHSLWELKEIVG